MYLVIKRLIDVLLSLCALIVLSPLLVLLLVLVRCKLGSPIIFKQARGGRKGKIFKVWKLKTMTNERDAQGELLPDSRRLTRLGQFLRKSSLDELPGLFNVLKGEMSLIGPRPFIAEYLPKYSAEQMRRHEVRPGITGWAQINGRNGLGWEERIALDVWYVDHIGFLLDLKIFFKTFVVLLRRKDVNAEGHATMPRFEGKGKEK